MKHVDHDGHSRAGLWLRESFERDVNFNFFAPSLTFFKNRRTVLRGRCELPGAAASTSWVEFLDELPLPLAIVKQSKMIRMIPLRLYRKQPAIISTSLEQASKEERNQSSNYRTWTFYSHNTAGSFVRYQRIRVDPMKSRTSDWSGPEFYPGFTWLYTIQGNVCRDETLWHPEASRACLQKSDLDCKRTKRCKLQWLTLMIRNTVTSPDR